MNSQKKTTMRPIKVEISNFHGDKPSDKIMQFCPQETQKLERRPLGNGHPKSTTIRFSKNGKDYQLYKGPNKTQNGGKFTYNVFLLG